MCYNGLSIADEKGVTALPPLSVHFPSSLTCPLVPRRTICFISARIVSRVSLSNTPRSFHSFHSFHKKTRLHPSDCKGFIHSAKKKSVLASPSESAGCALFHKT